MPFTLIREAFIPELESTARLLRHDGTGARVLSVANADENKVFGITFSTPGRDSTGVAHILEHSVLCGSRRYPVKEPFVELVKGSLNTFLNAMTYPDRTCYPVASTNQADFRNLMEVYLDAVFHPILDPDTFRQEGWHYETHGPEDRLEIKGVVYNEMKGAYSDPESRLADVVQESLFPDSPYAFDSGGDPRCIPGLDYERFKAFHERHYHPSNAFIFFYGDDDPDARLECLEPWLSEFGPGDPVPPATLQPRFEEPSRVERVYDSGDSGDARSYVTVNWMLGERVPTLSSAGTTRDEEPGAGEISLALSILSHMLAGTASSPLRRALIESGLGEDLAGTGLNDEMRQMSYSIGLKGVGQGDEDAVETLVLDTLRRLAGDGFDPATVEASMNTMEFALREKNTGRLPRGVAVMLGVLGTWIYGGDPIGALRFRGDLDRVRAGIARGGYFEDILRRLFVLNTHRTTVVLRPDSGEGARLAAETERSLSGARQGMSPEILAGIAQAARRLKERQERPDSPEALASIPSLGLADLETGARRIPIEAGSLEDATLLVHDLPTNGILYMDVGFDLDILPDPLVPYVGILGRLLLETGTSREDYISLGQRIGRNTGGIHGSTLFASTRGSAQPRCFFMLRAKALAGRQEELFAILSDVLLSARLDNRERFMQILLEEKSSGESSLVPSGHRVVNSRLRAGFSEADRTAERVDGLESLFFLRDLARRAESDWPSVLAELEELRRLVVGRHLCIVNLTADASTLSGMESSLANFLRGVPPGETRRGGRTAPATPPPSAEAITLPAQVNFVGKAADLHSLGYRSDGSIHVVNKYLQTTWLWEKIRVQGGAYGGFSIFDRNTGVFSFLSYRDPGIVQSLRSYDGTGGFLRSLEISERELVKTIVGTIGDVDAYLLPDAKGYTSMVHYLTGYTFEERQRTRDQILATTAARFGELAEVLDLAARAGRVAVMGSPEAIARAEAEGIGFDAVTKALA